jgi:hypothetical protein
MSVNKDKMHDFVPIEGGDNVTFGGGDGRIIGKGTIRTPLLDFENVYYVKELQHFNLFSVSQICDTKNKVFFSEDECLVLSKDFKLPEDTTILLRVPRNYNLYTFNMNDVQPEGDLTCLVAKASLDKSTRWHRRMAHVNFKTINKISKLGLVHGLPSKVFTNEYNCVACNKGKQHRASYKAITAVSTISEPLQLLHMDLFGPTQIRSIDHKYFCLVITDDFSRFCWVFFLRTKDETSPILKEFITLIENQLNKKVKGIWCDNGTEFKNVVLIELCQSKGIKRDYSNPRTPTTTWVAERKNRTLIDAARSMLADSKLPTMLWTEAVSTACYVLNRVSITRPHFKTPYELLTGKVPDIHYLKPFGCQVTILNTSDSLGKFDEKADEGYIVGYSDHSKAYRVYNLNAKKIEETFNLRYLEDKPNVQRQGHVWYFDLDYLTDYLGYTRYVTNQSAGTQESPTNNTGTLDDDSDSESERDEQTIVVPSFPPNHFAGDNSKETSAENEDESHYAEDLARLKKQEHAANQEADRLGVEFARDTEALLRQSAQAVSGNQDSANSSPISPDIIKSADSPAAQTPIPTSVSTDFGEPYTQFPSPSDLGHHQPKAGIFTSSSYDCDFGPTVNNLDTTIDVNPTATKRINIAHPQSKIIGDPQAPVRTRSTVKNTKYGQISFISYVSNQQRDNHTDFKHCLFACCLSQVEPTSISQALEDSSWLEAMQDEMLQFKNQ